jgi:RsiW-degrading membrane proteinase PrsW (M82 family)
MILGINISLLLGLIIPPLIYALIIYLTAPYRSVSFKNGLLFMMGGVVSITLIHTIYLLIPSLIASTSTLNESSFLKYFFRVALLEELVKYIMLVTIMKFINKEGLIKHPFRYMFYFALVGLGFAVIENMTYVRMYGEEVLYIRTITSTIMHMIFGMIFGYWIGLSKIYKSKFENRSVFGVITNKHKKLKVFIYTLIGFLSALTYHGMYNYNLVTSEESSKIISMIIIVLGLLSCKLLANNLNTQWKNRMKK